MKLSQSKRKIKLIKNICLLISSIIICLIILEFALRIFVGPYSIGSGYGAPVIDFHEKYYLLNSRGFRDRDFSYHKDNDTFRILVLGDSLSFGQGIKDIKDTFPKIIERRLNQDANDRSHEIINTAQMGFNTKDHLKLWNDEGFKYDPDQVIIAYFHNDFSYGQEIDGDKDTVWIKEAGKYLKKRSYVYFFFDIKLVNYIKIFWKYKIMIRFLDNSAKDDDSWKQELPQHIEEFKELLEAIKEKGSRPLVIILPYNFIGQDRPTERILEQFSEIIRAAEDEDTDYIKIKSIDYALRDDKASLVVNKEDHHPNELAHKMMADEIYGHMIKSGVLN